MTHHRQRNAAYPDGPGLRDRGFTPAEFLIVLAMLGVVGAVLGLVAVRGDLRPPRSGAAAVAAGSVAGGAASVPQQILGDIRGARNLGTTGGPACPGTANSTPAFWTSTLDAERAPVVAAYHVEPGTDTEPDSLVRASCAPLWTSLDQPMDPFQHTVGLADEHTLPASRWITVGDEVMYVEPASAGTPSLSVARGAHPVDHPLGERVAPVWVMAAPLYANDPDPVLHLTDAAGLPSDGPYQLLIGSEVVTVDGGYGTNDLGLADRPVPLDHATTEKVRAQGHEVGRPLAQWPREPRLDLALGTGETTLTLAGGAGLPAATPYGILVDDEPMTVTARISDTSGSTWLTVDRTAPAEHALHAVVKLGSTLAAPVALSASTIEIADAAGLPAAVPYRITVGDEPMIVTARTDGPARSATLVVSRPAPADRPAGTPVRYEPGVTLLCDGRPQCGAEVMAAPLHELDTRLQILGGGEHLPADGQVYDVVVGDESGTVTGRDGEYFTPVLTLRRPRPEEHGDGNVAVRYAPRTVEVFVPAGPGQQGVPAAVSTAVTRRPS